MDDIIKIYSEGVLVYESDTSLHNLFYLLLQYIDSDDLDFIFDLEQLSHHLSAEEHAKVAGYCFAHIQG